jgi:hypothetical protein
MVASLQGNMGMGTKEDESSTGCVWTAGSHHVTAHSRLARVLKLMNRYFFNFTNLFQGHSKPWIWGSVCISLGVKVASAHS